MTGKSTGKRNTGTKSKGGSLTRLNVHGGDNRGTEKHLSQTIEKDANDGENGKLQKIAASLDRVYRGVDKEKDRDILNSTEIMKKYRRGDDIFSN
ncbi:MAG: hypothetical protein UU94_C0021G0006 [Candidatus Collierbacteria bacterium GW2011_GWB2_42_12]|nr:MAG: hypothetical protein UU94_C0021G0006 [Candidatus Collierbacteria bacterium GW2011_GWB2_42_12]